jgi:hypothetical protein
LKEDPYFPSALPWSDVGELYVQLCQVSLPGCCRAEQRLLHLATTCVVRLLAYIVSGHASYLLVGLVGSVEGVMLVVGDCARRVMIFVFRYWVFWFALGKSAVV